MFVNFYKGLSQNYNKSIHSNSIYQCTDTNDVYILGVKHSNDGSSGIGTIVVADEDELNSLNVPVNTIVTVAKHVEKEWRLEESVSDLTRVKHFIFNPTDSNSSNRFIFTYFQDGVCVMGVATCTSGTVLVQIFKETGEEEILAEYSEVGNEVFETFSNIDILMCSLTDESTCSAYTRREVPEMKWIKTEGGFRQVVDAQSSIVVDYLSDLNYLNAPVGTLARVNYSAPGYINGFPGFHSPAKSFNDASTPVYHYLGIQFINLPSGSTVRTYKLVDEDGFPATYTISSNSIILSYKGQEIDIYQKQQNILNTFGQHTYEDYIINLYTVLDKKFKVLSFSSSPTQPNTNYGELFGGLAEYREYKYYRYILLGNEYQWVEVQTEPYETQSTDRYWVNNTPIILKKIASGAYLTCDGSTFKVFGQLSAIIYDTNGNAYVATLKSLDGNTVTESILYQFGSGGTASNMTLAKVTQEEYDSLTSKDSNTVYLIVE